MPPLNPDVAIVHVQRADANGNAQIWGIIGEQKEAAFAAGQVIVTAEEIVDEDRDPLGPQPHPDPRVSSWMRSVTCRTAAHPSYTQGYYDRDNEFYLDWDEISETDEAVQDYLDEWVYGVRDREDYWQKLGRETHARLRVPHRSSAPVDYGDY